MLPFVLISVGVLIVAIILDVVKDQCLYMLLMILILPVILIPADVLGEPSTDSFPLESKVEFNGEYHTIYFADFMQDGDTVIITPYARSAWHWLESVQWEIIDAPITIVLTDNDNKFTYTDRATGQVINENEGGQPIFATQ